MVFQDQMARALFKSWFVDFDLRRAKMEGAWRRGKSLLGLPYTSGEAYLARLLSIYLLQVIRNAPLQSNHPPAGLSSNLQASENGIGQPKRLVQKGEIVPCKNSVAAQHPAPADCSPASPASPAGDARVVSLFCMT